MPIRLNLLAEAKALEEMRRRDPVKRAAYVCAGLVGLMLFWSLFLYSKALVRRSELGRLETDLAAEAEPYQRVLANEKLLAETRLRLTALGRLATNRHLNGTVLQALQQTIVPDVRLTRLKTEQAYVLTEATRARTNTAGKVIEPAKPATATERLVIILDAVDSSPNPGDRVNQFKESLAASPYFSALHGKGNEPVLRSLSAPQTEPETGRAHVQFTLECRCPPVVR